MRVTTAIVSTVALTLGLAAPAMAHPRFDIAPPLTVDLTHAATDNVGFVERFHEHFGAAGGKVTSNDWNDGEEFFVVTDPRGVYTYDISEPEHPVQMDFLFLNQGDEDGEPEVFAQEDPSTDGHTLLVDGINDAGEIGLQIISIENPTNMSVLGSYNDLDHTWTCVSDVASGNGCGFAYGRSNNIIDIRDPQNPVKLTGWKSALGFGTGNGGKDYTHDVTEIRPGLVMTAGAEPKLMDTTDAANPVLLSHISLFDHKSPNDSKYPIQREFDAFGFHSIEWAQNGNDAFIVMGTELVSQNTPIVPASLVGYGVGDDCNGEDQAVLETWDARPINAAFDAMTSLEADGMSHADARTAAFGDGKQVKFIRLDSYAASGNGTFLDGQAPGSVLFCAHWMDLERDFKDGGRMVAGYYNRGARFVEITAAGTIDSDGKDVSGIMREIGWFVGADAYTGSARWITDEVVYVMDYARGMDVITIANTEATSTYAGVGSVSDNAMTVAEMDALGIAPEVPASGNSTALIMIGMALAATAFARRRVTAVEA